MPVAKGEPWGEVGRLPADAPVVETDHALSRAVEFARATGRPRPVFGLTGGDLWRTLGAPIGGATRLAQGTGTRVTVDVGWLTMDDGELEHAFVAHCVARTRFWGHSVAIMNAEWFGAWDLAPKGHPGDGWLDVTEAELRWGELHKVKRRLPTGTHLPHPDITTSRVREAEFDFPAPRRLYVDSSPFHKVRRLKVRIEPASLTVVV